MGAAVGTFAEQILGALTAGVLAVDAEGELAAFNVGAQRILGCPEGDVSEALGRDCRQVLATHPGVVRLLLDGIARKTPISRAELTLASGTIGFTLYPIRDANDRPLGAALIFRDLAPIERADEQERLRERLAALGQMAADLAHAIRNPLAGMEVLAGLLRRRLGDRPDERALVDELRVELRAVSGTVSQGLAFVRPEAPVAGPVDVVQLAQEALDVARTRVEFTGAVERSWDEGVPPVEADAGQLRTALSDLIVNALEAMAEGGGTRLALAVQLRESDVWISVTDDGPGVAPELREKIFYPFFTTKERGAGVGLASAQKVVASHGGHIELDARRGRGCAFHVRLPANARRGAMSARGVEQ